MKVHHHTAISLVVGVAAALTTQINPLVAVAVALVAGVGIDFDHFAIAILLERDIEPVVYCLTSPVDALKNQYQIFSGTAVTPNNRLLSHVIIIVTVTPAVYAFISEPIGLIAGAAMAAHIAADTYVTFLA